VTDLAGKVAIVTGAATGIGRAVALELATRGAHVVINYAKSESEARETVRAVEQLGAQALLAQGDVANDADCRRVVAEAIAKWNRVDVLVNNAGTTVFVPHAELEALTEDAWDRVFAVNVRGAFQMARAATPALKASGKGAIVNISSTAGSTGVGSSIAYAASKAALDNLTVSLARALAPAIRVNAVAPGFVDTRWLVDGYGEKLDAMRKLVKQQTPLREVTRPENVAQVVASVVIGMDLVTGQIITVDGGYVIRG
jgi:3-oxoacyl-[acyl-carrier protein] reductase